MTQTYLTRHISRFGGYFVDLIRLPQPPDVESELVMRENEDPLNLSQIRCATILHVFGLYPQPVNKNTT